MSPYPMYSTAKSTWCSLKARITNTFYKKDKYKTTIREVGGLGGLEFWSANLNMHLDNGFPNESGSKESPERNQEVATGDTSQVE